MTEEAIEALKADLATTTKDKFAIGDVIKWTSAGRWNYAAIKTDGGWFTTARSGNMYVNSRLDSYEELVEILSRSETSNVLVSTGWAAVT